MKNMFKMMGVALLAGAMLFTACKKDEEDTTPTNTNNGTTTTHAISISYNGNTWNADTIYAEINGGLVNASIYVGTDDEPLFTFKCPAEVGVYGFAGTDWYARYYAMASDDDPTAVSTQTGSINIRSISDNHDKISVTVSAEMGEAGSGNMLSVVATDAILVMGTK